MILVLTLSGLSTLNYLEVSLTCQRPKVLTVNKTTMNYELNNWFVII